MGRDISEARTAQTGCGMMSSSGENIPRGARALHVLTLTPFYPTDQDDAAGCFISEPLAWLARVGVHNTVFAVQPVYRGAVRASGLLFLRVGCAICLFRAASDLPSAGAFLFARIVSQVRKLHASQHIDLIHAHGPLPCGHAAMLLSAELGIPYVVSVHGLDAFSTVQVSGRAGRVVPPHFSARLSFFAARHLHQRTRARGVLEGSGESCRTSVVYNGVDPELFAPVSGPTSAAPVVLSVGTLIPIKGHATLIRAAAALASEFPELRWEIIGDGPERAQPAKPMRAIAGHGKSAIPGKAVAQASRVPPCSAARCSRCPAATKGWAAFTWKPCPRASPQSAAGGRVSQRSFNTARMASWSDPDNDRELALAIAMLLKDETRRRNISVAARDTILDRFTLAHQAESLLRIYREAAE